MNKNKLLKKLFIRPLFNLIAQYNDQYMRKE
jgi:hypothetical protein